MGTKHDDADRRGIDVTEKSSVAKLAMSDNRENADLTLRSIAEMIENSRKETLDEIRGNERRIENLITEQLSSIHAEMGVLKRRMDNMESKPFDTQRTVVISGLKPDQYVDDKTLVSSILDKIGLSELGIVDVKRMNFRGRGPGLLKVELVNEESKKKLLGTKCASKM